MNKNSLIKRIPNVLTLVNMTLGLVAVLFLFGQGHPHKPLVVTGVILLGGIADFFDGFLARKLNAATEMGKQLDSFADLLTFGIAPVSLVNYLAPYSHSVLVLCASLIYMAASAYRLARYNLGDFSNHFIGLPITAAGIILAVYGAALYHWAVIELPGVYGVATPVVLVVLSVMMVSKVRVKRVGAK
ncbi:MAG: CDP-alcohol phosphatidyltransferase family protein [Oscillospiraceae bacterium]|nr:CDP-alcohol phosphatidyltransferase family protein [Oscillospiraceae bacterium]